MPELTPIDEWAAINDISDSVEKRKKYSAYMKAEFLREGIDGETMRETFGAIDQSLRAGLKQDGLNEEEIADALKPSQATFEDKFKIVDRAIGVVTDNDDLRALSDYDAFQKVTSEQTDLPPDYLARGDELRMRAEEVVNANYEDAAQWVSVNEDVPFTRITLGDGTVRLIGNNAAVGLTPLQAYEKSLARGSIKEEDIDKVLNLMQKDEKGFEAFRHERFAETSKALGDAMKDDEVLNNNLSVMIGEYGRNGQVSDVSRDTFKTTLLSKIPAMNAMYSDADVNAVLDYLVGQQAMVSGEAPFDSDNPTSGIRDFGYGYTAIHQSLLQNKEQFDKATADMSPEKVRVLELQRDAYRTKLFPQYSQALKNSSVGDEWTEFYATKKVDGMEDADILDAFIEGKEYDWLAANVQHLALAVGEGFTDIMWGIGAAMGNDTARDNLLENLRDREARRMTANLFGQEMGFGMEVAEVAAPLIADMLGTVALTTATGALGAGTAVAGSIAKNTMKSTFRNTIQSVAKNATIDLGQTTAKQAVPTIRKFSEAYAGIVGSKATGYAAMFTSAATRSGTMTYANVYDVLKRENEANGGALTDEEIHQKALGAGLTAGAITGSITLAFSTMGAGGVEDFILNRATGKDVKRVFDALSRRELTDAQYQAALSKVLANGHEEFTKKAGVGVVRRMAVGAAGEAAEEGADEYFNSIVQAVATNQDLSFLEVASQAGMGAVFGGILGAGTPAISRAYRAVTRKLDGGIGDEVARREVESKVAEQAANLIESGSPVTAEVFQQAMATAPERLPQTPTDAEEAPADAEEAPADVDGEPDVIWSPDVTQFDQELGEFEPDSPIYAADVALSLLSPLAQDTLAKVEAFNNGESAWASAPDLIKARNEIRLYREELEKQTGTERLTEFAGMLELEQQLDDEIEARKAGGRNQLFGHLFDGINLPPDEVEEAVAEAKSAKKKKPKVKQATVKAETPPAARMKATRRTGVTPQTRVEVTRRDAKYLELASDPEKNKDSLMKLLSDAAEADENTVGPVWQFTKTLDTVFGATETLEENQLGFRFRLTKSDSDAQPVFLTGEIIKLKKEPEDAQDVAYSLFEKGIISKENYDTVDAATAKQIFKRLSQQGKNETDEYTARLKESYKNEERKIGRELRMPKEELLQILDRDVVFEYPHRGSTHYVVYGTNQTLSADPVIYDANNNVIPLSQRFSKSAGTISSNPTKPSARMRATQRTGVTPQTRVEVTPPPKGESVDTFLGSRVTPDITEEDKQEYLQELQEKFGLSLEEAQEALEQSIVDAANETDTGDLDDGEDEPNTPEEEKTVEDTFKERVDELIQTGMIVNINSGTHGLPTGLKRDFIKAEKDRLVREIKALQKDKKSDRYVPSTDDVLKAYGVSADAVNKRASVPNATGELMWHSDYGYLFNNDPLVVKEALKRNQPVVLPDGYDGPFNADLFVVIDGRVTEVKEPQRVGGEQKKTKAETASLDASDALARSFELINAFNPSDVEVTFRQAGFSPKRVFAQASKRMEGESDEEYVERLEQLERDLTVGSDQIFVLDESMTVKEAIKHFRRWAGGLYAGLIESHRTIDVNLYRNAANIRRMGLPQEQTDEILASSVADFVADIEASIHMQGLRQKLEPLMTDGSLASADMNDIMNALFDSDIARELNLAEGLLSMRAIDRKLKELGKLQWGKTTTAKTDLIAQADTPAKKLAAFLYYATAGKGTKAKGMVSDEEFNKSIVGFAKAKAFKAGWEEKIVKRSLESLLDIEQFKPKPNAPFPNFMTAARRVGDRVRKRSEGFRVANKQKRAEVDLETVQVNSALSGGNETHAKRDYHAFKHEAAKQINREIASLPEEQNKEALDTLKEIMTRVLGFKGSLDNILDTGLSIDQFDPTSLTDVLIEQISAQRAEGEENVTSSGDAGSYFANNYTSLPPTTVRYLIYAGLEPVGIEIDSVISSETVQEEVIGSYDNYRGIQEEVEDMFNSFQAPNLLDRKAAQLYRAKNNEDMVRLGLVDGNPQSVIDALEEIKKNGVDESHQLVAGLLLRNKQAILNTAFEVIDNPDSGYAGLYDESANKVTLNLSSSYGSGLESVLLHEYLHVATVGLLRSDNLSRKQRAALTRLQNLRLLVRDAYERSGKRHIAIDNGVSNNEEFVASVFTSVAFQNAVRSLPEKGWFRRILNAVKDFFGIPPKDKLRKAFDDLVDFLNMEQAPKERVIDTLGGRKFFAPNENTRIVQDALDRVRAESEAEKQQRYSDPILPSVDEQYLQAVADGDIEEAQRLVKEAANFAGYSVEAYHGTVGDFTIFDLDQSSGGNDLGFHFGSKTAARNRVKDIQEAVKRNERGDAGSPKVNRFFLKLNNPLRLSESRTGNWQINDILNQIFEAETINAAFEADAEAYFNDELSVKMEKFGIIEEIPSWDMTSRSEQNKWLDIYLKSKGYDGIVYKNEVEEANGADSYIVFNPASIKSADAVTYENRRRQTGVIPLSERFNLNVNDIRFSPLDGIASDDTLTPEQRRTMDSLIDEVISMTVPADVPVVEMVEGNADLFADRPNALFATTYSQIGGKQVVTILLNRNAAQRAVFEMTNQVYDTTHVKAILESILNEEIVHAAELRTIAPAELDAVLEEMVEDDLLNTVDDYTDNLVRRNKLKTAIQNGDQRIRRQMLGELLRMKAQRITRGYTTEQDKAFYATNPRFHQVMLRFLMGVFKRFAAKRNLRKDNPEMARMVNKMAYEVALLRSGVFRIAERLHFDINSPDANVADLELRLSATLEDEPEKEITEATTTEEIKNRYPLFRAFDIALGSFTEGEYKANTGIMRMLNGDLDPRIMELRRQADAVKQAVDTKAKAIFKEVSKMVQNDPNIDDETLADFLGRPNDMDLPEGYLQAREKVFQERYKREVNERGRVTSEEREAMYKEEVTDKAANEVARMIDSAKSKQAAAKRYINRNNPALYRKLTELRNFLDSLSKIFTEQFDTQGKLRAVVDTRLGIYVVRAYRAFLEEGYLDRIIKIAKGEAKAGDELMVRQYQMVYELFEETYHRQFAKEERKRERENDVPQQDRATYESLIEASTEELNRLREKTGQDPIRGAIIDYLYSLDPNTKYAHSHTNIANSVTKSLVSNIRKRKQMPLALRQLLGQYDDADALNNVMRSIYTVAHAASNESFITNMIRLGRVEGAKFIYNIDEVREMQRTEEGRIKTASMVNLRTGGRVNEAVLRKETTGDEVETDYSKALDYYVDKEILDQLRMQFQRDATSDLSFEKKKVEQFFNVWKTLTGASLGAKTLFSFGFYIRNVLGNLAFFAPLQGLNPIKVAKKLGHVTRALKGQTGQIDAYTAELTSLNLIQGDLTVRTVQDLLRGKTTLEQQEEEIGKVTEKIRALKAKGKKVSEKTLKPLMNYLMDLSQAVDAFYKIAAYEHELDYQKKARAHDITTGKDTGFLDLSDYDLKTRAAKKVRQTSQSYVDAYESVKYATKKWSFILAPFLRFRFDIIRIMFDGTPKLIRQEINSDNPIERKRGIQRLAGFVGTIGGMSFTIPLALRMMSGIGEEEEELLREGYLPDYQKNATLWFFGKDKFVDATFLNPLGSVTDSLLRAFEHALNGDFSTAAVTLIKMLGEEYGGQQILSSAVASAMANKDARTGDPIYEEDDGLNQVWKFMKYVYLEAYNPRVALAGSRAIEAAVGDEATKWDRSVAGIISREFMPSRLSDIDWERALRNGISKKQDERNRMRSALNKLRSSGSLTDGDIESATDTFVRGQQKVDSDLSNYILAARNMGVSDMEIDRSLGFYKISKDRVSDLRYGVFRRPDIPEPLATGLQEMGAVGVERLQKAYARLREYPSFSFLD